MKNNSFFLLQFLRSLIPLFTITFLFYFSLTFQPKDLFASKLIKRLPKFREVSSFSLIESNGDVTTEKELFGKIWLVNFIFTRCNGPCPILSSRMSHLEKELPQEIQLVSITVDPDYDTPHILKEYAEKFKADQNRWLFLTGGKKEVYDLLIKGFHIAVEENLEQTNYGERFIHSQNFLLIDQNGFIRKIYHGEDWQDLKQSLTDTKLLLVEKNKPWVLKLPFLNALLNGICIFFLMNGLYFIKKKMVTFHKICMLTAFLVSLAFLASYLIYHYHVGSIPYKGQGWLRTLYFTILISHTLLAASVPFLALLTFYWALKADFKKHVKLAHWTFPIWLYVSFTGIIIYLMVYS